MINCRDIENNLLDILSGEISPERLAHFQDHIENCVSCKQLVSSYASIFSELPVPQISEVPQTLWRSVQSRINHYEERDRTGSLVDKMLGRRFAVALKSFGIVVAIAAGIFVGSSGSTTEATEESSVVDDYSTIFAQSAQTTFSSTAYDVAAPEESSK